MFRLYACFPGIVIGFDLWCWGLCFVDFGWVGLFADVFIRWFCAVGCFTFVFDFPDLSLVVLVACFDFIADLG